MNYSEAKNIDIVNFLSKKGIQPVKTKGQQYAYLSPFRNEAAPSFSVNIIKNKWYDFGIGEGGDIIELVKRMFNVNFQEALNILGGNSYITFYPKPSSLKKANDGLEIKKVHKEIKSLYLFSYLKSRSIQYDQVKYCDNLCEVEYLTQSGKLISALGFKNDSGGYEMRNKFTKLSTSPKAISTIKGDRSVLSVFEGFMDYLSALTYYGVEQLDGTTVVLNGVGQKKVLFELLPDYSQIVLYADNDLAGEVLLKEVLEKHTNVVNMADKIYPDYKDFNKYLCSRK